MTRTRSAVVLAWTVLGLTPLPAQAQGALDELQRVVATLPAGLLDVSDLEVTTDADGSVSATGVVSLLGARTDVFVAFQLGRGDRHYLIGLRPDDWSLAKAVPGLALPALDGMTFSNVGLVIASDSVEQSAGELNSAEFAFYSDLLKSDDFTITLRPGINLFASIPVDRLPPGHPLLSVMDALGIEHGVVRLQGTLGRSLAMLSQPGAGGSAALRDVFLRAELPPMRPPGSPEWFRSGQLALQITGDPSVSLVGEMNVLIQQDELAFFLAATLARQGVSLAGGLKAEAGWNQPFGIAWLTLYKVVLKIGVGPTGSVQLGFGGDLVIGQKDMQVAVQLAISPAGVPTNFIFDGASEAGFGLSDLLELQAKMAAARQAAQQATGTAGPSPGRTIPVDQLPPVEFRGVGLKFAPKADPDLGVEQGMAIKGRMLLGSPDGSLRELASVDVNVGEEGLWVRGSLAAFQAGPLTWQDALIDLTATAEDQHLRLVGDVQLLGSRQKVDLELSRTQLRFSSVTRLYDLFAADVDALAAFDLRQPKFRVHAVARSELSDVLQPMVREGATAFAAASGVAIQQADVALGGIRVALNNADATVDELRAALEQQRAAARATVDRLASESAALARAVAAARARRGGARSLWSDTPVRQVSLRNSRRNAWLRAVAAYNVAAGRYAAHLATVAAARRVLDALPPVDQNIALMAASAAATAIRRQLEEAERNLEALREQHARLVAAIAQGGTLLALDLVEVTADLDALQSGQALEWRVAGTFVNEPFDLTAGLDFSEPAAAAGALLTQLVRR